MRWWHILGIVGLLGLGARMAIFNSTRGFRNRNPGNIRNNPAFTWNGQVGVDDAGFVIFDCFDNGVRAIGRVLDSYKNRGLVTVRDIISTYAPPVENNTESYIDSVASALELPADMPVPEFERGNLVSAIIHHENGVNPFSSSFIEHSLAIA